MLLPILLCVIFILLLQTSNHNVLKIMVLLALLIADPMERSRNSKLSRRDQLVGWSAHVGDITSPGTEEVLRALLLHSPALRSLRGILGTPRRRLRLQHLGRRRLPLHARPLPEVLAIEGQSRHRFCHLPTVRNGGASLLKATKYVKISIDRDSFPALCS